MGHQQQPHNQTDFSHQDQQAQWNQPVESPGSNQQLSPEAMTYALPAGPLAGQKLIDLPTPQLETIARGMIGKPRQYAMEILSTR